MRVIQGGGRRITVIVPGFLGEIARKWGRKDHNTGSLGDWLHFLWENCIKIQFSGSYSTLTKQNLRKGGYFQVSANNSVCGGISRLKYQWQDSVRGGGKLFSLDSTSGTICLEGALDFEKSQTHRLAVQATDSSEFLLKLYGAGHWHHRLRQCAKLKETTGVRSWKESKKRA